MAQAKKKGFKMPTAFTLLFGIVVVIGILTYFVPAGSYEKVPGETVLVNIAGEEYQWTLDEAATFCGREVSAADNATTLNCELEGEMVEAEIILANTTWKDAVVPETYERVEQQPLDAMQILLAPIKGFIQASDLIVFLLVIGAFIEITMVSGALDAGLGNVMRTLSAKKREILLIPVLMTLFALGGTTYGMAEETIPFYLILVPIMIYAGFDSITAVATILLGAGIGTLASTINPFATGVASSSAGIPLFDGILLRVVMFVVLLGIGIAFVMRYANRVKKDINHSVLGKDVHDIHTMITSDSEQKVVEMTTRRKWILVVFALSFILMVLGNIPWYDFGVTIPDFIAPFMLDGDFANMSVLFLVATIIIGIINGDSEAQFMDTFIAGAKGMVSVALIIGVARGITIAMEQGLIIDTLLFQIETILRGTSQALFVSMVYVLEILLSFLIPSTSGLAAATMPILAPLSELLDVQTHLVVTAYQSASGIVNLITPTSAIVMGALAIGRVPLGKWLKFVAPLLVVIFIVSIALMALPIW